MFHAIRLFRFTFILLLAACTTVTQQEEKVSIPIWPLPPDQPRFIYEATLRSFADIIVETSESRMLHLMAGTAISTEPVLNKPAAIVARKGRIYVADTGTHTIVVFDIPRRKLFRFGVRGPGNLKKPSGLALDDEMNVYVADAMRREVVVYDSLGLFQRTVGGPEDLERPTGVAVSRDGERIYAIDRSNNESNNHHVVVYDKEGRKLQVIGSRGNGEGQFNVPLQGAVAPDGTLYVLDSGNFRVQAFDRDGKFLRAFGGPGNGLGNFARPRGIAVDDEGNIYVSDASFNNFQIYNPN
ncbi:MAG: 6-bladed beta-propeller, partial [Gallionella sp.]|nr:6-bladed beta-propeller [Gallionella sp.]